MCAASESRGADARDRVTAEAVGHDQCAFVSGVEADDGNGFGGYHICVVAGLQGVRGCGTEERGCRHAEHREARRTSRAP